MQGRDVYLVRKAVAGADRSLGTIFEAFPLVDRKQLDAIGADPHAALALAAAKDVTIGGAVTGQLVQYDLPKEARMVIILISRKYRRASLPGVQVLTKG